MAAVLIGFRSRQLPAAACEPLGLETAPCLPASAQWTFPGACVSEGPGGTRAPARLTPPCGQQVLPGSSAGPVAAEPPASRPAPGPLQLLQVRPSAAPPARPRGPALPPAGSDSESTPRSADLGDLGRAGPHLLPVPELIGWKSPKDQAAWRRPLGTPALPAAPGRAACGADVRVPGSRSPRCAPSRHADTCPAHVSPHVCPHTTQHVLQTCIPTRAPTHVPSAHKCPHTHVTLQAGRPPGVCWRWGLAWGTGWRGGKGPPGQTAKEAPGKRQRL